MGMARFVARVGTAADLSSFVVKKGLWWCIPAVGILLIAGLLGMIVESGVVSPFIYTLF
jgi:hypothetical protein